MGLTYEEQIWNRACVVDVPNEVGVGDRQLWALLRVDGVVMSGGVGFAVDVLDAEAFARAVIASRYFGLDELVKLLQSMAHVTPTDDGEPAPRDRTHRRSPQGPDRATPCPPVGATARRVAGGR